MPKSSSHLPIVPAWRRAARRAVLVAVLAVAGLLFWQALRVGGVPDPTSHQAETFVPALDIGVLVFREGLECILVLAAIVGSLSGSGRREHRRPIAIGATLAFFATLVTWVIAVRILDSLTDSIPALQIQAATGLVAVCVLVVVMNWFFHKMYWTGWIGMHNRRKQSLLDRAREGRASRTRLLIGFGLIGFTSLYREGVEVVLFLQSYRLKLGNVPVLSGVLLGLAFTSVVGVLTFVAHRRLPYRKMLVVTGVLLGIVLLVMVGEQAQEMQLAHWLPTTQITWLTPRVPDWMGLWFSVFPTVETLAAQAAAVVFVLGSYFLARQSALPARST